MTSDEFNLILSLRDAKPIRLRPWILAIIIFLGCATAFGVYRGLK